LKSTSYPSAGQARFLALRVHLRAVAIRVRAGWLLAAGNFARWPGHLACRVSPPREFGIIFQDSHLPLEKWFLALHIMVESKKAVTHLLMKNTSPETERIYTEPFPKLTAEVGEITRTG